MKKALLIAVFYFFVIKLFAQDFPDFALPTKEELELTECPFDKYAGAVVLIHEAFSYSEDNLQLITSHHLRIKILKQSGSDVANIKIPFIRIYNFERIIELQAITINSDERGGLTKQKVNRKSIFTSNLNEIFGEINFTFPSVKAGSILEYQFKSIKRNYFGLQDWYFQREIPVLTSRYHLKMIPSKQFSYRMIQGSETETTILPGKDNIFVEMRKIPALLSEPFMDSEKDYRQRINFTVNGYDSRWGSGQVGMLTPSWPLLNISLLLDSHFGPQIVAPLPALNSFIDSAKLEKDELKRMQTIYKLVIKRMSWNKVNNIYANEPAKVWEKQTGDNGDINMLLVNLLNRAQLKAYPLLVSKRQNGKVDTTYSYSDQFNALLACVIINRKKHILDATDKYNLGDIPPVSILNTKAFLIDRQNGELVSIIQDSTGYNEVIELKAELSDDGQIKGTAVINNAFYARIEKLHKFKVDSANLKERYLKDSKMQLSITDYSITDNENDNGLLTEKLVFTAPLTGSGDYNFIPMNFFSSLVENPFLADKRFTDINFGYNQHTIIKGTVKLSDNITIEAFPENTVQEFADAGIRISRTSKLDKSTNSYEFEINIERVKSYYTNAEYAALKNAYKILFAKLADQAVLKKK